MTEDYTKKEFQVSSDLSLVQKASSEVLAFLKPLGLSEAYLFDVKLCLEEALINAMKYGHALNKDLKVRLAAEYNSAEVRITVEDQGGGFDLKKLVDCTAGDNVLKSRGRGVYLIHQLMDEVQYNAKGNCLRMTKFLKKEVGKKTSKGA